MGVSHMIEIKDVDELREGDLLVVKNEAMLFPQYDYWKNAPTCDARQLFGADDIFLVVRVEPDDTKCEGFNVELIGTHFLVKWERICRRPMDVCYTFLRMPREGENHD